MKMKARILVIAALVLFSVHSIAQNIGDERARAKNILNLVSSDIEKNYYDATLKGLDWKALTQQAREKIDKAQTIGQVYTAIFHL